MAWKGLITWQIFVSYALNRYGGMRFREGLGKTYNDSSDVEENGLGWLGCLRHIRYRLRDSCSYYERIMVV